MILSSALRKQVAQVSTQQKRRRRRSLAQVISDVSQPSSEQLSNRNVIGTTQGLVNMLIKENRHLDVNVRDIPVVDAKYLPVWQRAFAKLKAQFVLAKFHSDIKLYGTGSYSVMNATDTSQVVGKSRSEVTADLDQIGAKQKFPCCLIHPNSKFKTFWNVVLALLLLYTATVMPWRMAFIDTVMWDDWFIAELVIDGLFFCDFLVNCFSAFYDYEGVLVTDRRKIICAYAQGWMMLDLVACFPFGLVEQSETTQSTDSSESGSYKNFLRLLRLPRLYRLFRISRIFKLFKMRSHNSCIIKLQDFFRLKQSAVRLMAVFVTVIVFGHIVACIWVFISKLDGNGPDTWLFRSGYIDDPNDQIYLASLYWAFTTMSTVGYGDITAKTDLEKFLAITLMLFGVCFFSFVIGSLSSIFNRIDSREAILNNKMAIIDEFAKESQLDKDLKQRLRYALQYSTEKTGFTWIDKQHIFNELPRALKYEVALVMHKGAIKELSFFQGKDHVFIYTIVPFLMSLFVGQGDFVYKEGEYADEIYFIHRGRINLVHEVDEKIYVYKAIQRGSYFGDIEIIKQLTRKYNTQAAWPSDLLTLNRNLYTTIEQDFPEVARELLQVAEVRDKLNSKARTQLLIDLRTRHRRSGVQTHKGTKPISASVTASKSDPELKLAVIEQQLNAMDERFDGLMEYMDQKFRELEQRCLNQTPVAETKVSYAMATQTAISGPMRPDFPIVAEEADQVSRKQSRDSTREQEKVIEEPKQPIPFISDAPVPTLTPAVSIPNMMELPGDDIAQALDSSSASLLGDLVQPSISHRSANTVESEEDMDDYPVF